MSSITKTRTIRIAIIDDHPILANALQRLLQLEPDFEVVANLQSGEEAIKYFEANQTSVDIVILDLQMEQRKSNDLAGFEVARYIFDNVYMPYYNEVSILIMSGWQEKYMIDLAFRLGVKGYLAKECDSDQLFKAIRDIVLDGKKHYEGKIRDILNGNDGPSLPPINPPDLTGAEKNVLDLIAQGFSNKKIAEIRGTGVGVVEYHRSNLKKKFCAASSGNLIALAYKLGYLQGEIKQWPSKDEGASDTP